jgi:hypothetical protein
MDGDREGETTLGQDPSLSIVDKASRGGGGEEPDAIILCQACELLTLKNLQDPESQKEDEEKEAYDNGNE